jgi:hypothetical protein
MLDTVKVGERVYRVRLEEWDGPRMFKAVSVYKSMDLDPQCFYKDRKAGRVEAHQSASGHWYMYEPEVRRLRGEQVEQA